MTKQSEHLSSAQIENYGNRASGAGPDAAQGDEHQRAADQHVAGQRMDDQSTTDQSTDQNTADQNIIDQRSNDQRSNQRTNDLRTNDQRVEAHLADCPSCRNRLLDFHRARFAVLAEPADPKLRTVYTPECPSDDDLRQLAAGLSPDAVATKLTQHAATCDHCGPLLLTFTEDFSDDFSPEEQAALANLQSSSAAWQKKTARQMMEAARAHSIEVSAVESDKKSPTERPAPSFVGRKTFFWKWVLLPATAAVIALAVFSIWYTQRDTPEKVEALLAQAYTKHRTIEFRFPGADYARLEVQLGGESGSSLEFSEANEIIRRERQNSPSSTAWLQASARADILRWEPESAIKTLDQAIQQQPNSGSLMLDLAMAHFELGEISRNPNDYAKALTLIKTVLKDDPSNPIALYNQALLDERLHHLDEAIHDWTVFLDNEKDKNWAEEASKKQAVLKNHE